MMGRLGFVSSLVLGLGLISTARGDLTAFYSGNGNANDSVSGQNGTLQNGAGFGPGLSGQALLFNGANQYVSVPNDSNWSFGSNPFSINVFANFNVITSVSNNHVPNVLVSDDQGPGDVDKWIFFYDGAGHLSFDLDTPSSGFLTLAAPSLFFATTNTWYSFAITRSGSSFSFYVDGVSLGTVTSNYAIGPATAPLTIGEAEGQGYLNGSLENLGIYNNALTSSQVAALAIPEPMSVVLLGLGMLGVVAFHRARTRPILAIEPD